MSEAEARDSVLGGVETAGGLLRKARRAQGLELEGLAAQMKVAPRKLELLESNRLDDLPDATFARALAQSMCRALRIDPAPVMALMPQAEGLGLAQLNQGLNTPFRDRSQGAAPTDWSVLARPVVWAPALIILAAIGVNLLPSTESRASASLIESPSFEQTGLA
jgi:cytoskeleton protein RodZ